MQDMNRGMMLCMMISGIQGIAVPLLGCKPDIGGLVGSCSYSSHPLTLLLSANQTCLPEFEGKKLS